MRSSRFCEESTPIDSNWVNIDLTEQSTGVPIVLYNDNLEDNNVILRDTLYTSSISYYLPMEVVYTAEAYYRSGPNTIIAVDSRRLDQTFQNCGQTCYENNEITLDLVLLIKRGQQDRILHFHNSLIHTTAMGAPWDIVFFLRNHLLCFRVQKESNPS